VDENDDQEEKQQMNSDRIISSTDRILVTGSNGFIGVKVVESLLEHGFANLRCFVRPSSKLDNLKKSLEKYPAGRAAEIISGDLLSHDDCRKAAEGVSVIIHLAAGFDKSFAGAFMNSALTTRNLVEAFRELGQPRRFVNVSSFGVYSNVKMARGALLDETSPLEDGPQERFDAYGFGKLKQEEIVREQGRTRGLPWVILRPGMVYGPGKSELSGRVGINTFGFFIHLGGGNELPMTFVDNCAEAIVLAAFKPGVDGEIFNVVDDDRLTSREFLAQRKAAKDFFSIGMPYPLARLGCQLWENISRKRHGQLPPVFNLRRCAAEWQGNSYTNVKLHQRLGWKQKVGLAEAMNSFLAQYR
jgi:nucleoside-diphosphate-sugar epimerase